MRRKRVCRRWPRRAGIVAGVLATGYAGIFAVAGCSSSPTDQRLRLSDGRTLAYSSWRSPDDTAPAARRVILIHGAPTDASSWTRFREEASETVPDTEWIAVDRLGYGNSSRGSELSLDEHARAIAPLLDTGDHQRVILVGHSYGGPVALRAAAMFPEEIDGIVLAAGACDGDMNDAQWFRRAVDSISGVIPGSWATANRELLALTDENDRVESELARIECPVVIVHGTWDPVCPFEGTTRYLRKHLVNAERVEVIALDRAGHNVHLSYPADVADAVRSVGGLAK